MLNKDRTKSSVEETYENIDKMRIGELYELLSSELDTAKEEGYEEELPKVVYLGETMDARKVRDLCRYGIVFKFDIRLADMRIEPRDNLELVRIGKQVFNISDFFDEIEFRTNLLRRLLRKIFLPRKKDVREMDEE